MKDLFVMPRCTCGHLVTDHAIDFGPDELRIRSCERNGCRCALYRELAQPPAAPSADGDDSEWRAA